MDKLKKGDEVIVLTGKDKGKHGRIVQVIRSLQKVIVENVNMVKRHTKANPAKGDAGGVIEKEMPLHISNIALLNPLSNKADRAGVKTLEDGHKVRFFKSNNEVVDL